MPLIDLFGIEIRGTDTVTIELIVTLCVWGWF